MLKISESQVESVRDQLGATNIVGVGYRLIIKPVEARKGMETAEADKFSTLARSGFEVKTDKEQAKETHGSNVGIIVHAGPDCYNSGALKDCDPWAKEGDIVIFPRYAGNQVELPPGSGEIYYFMADDDLLGKYEGIEL